MSGNLSLLTVLFIMCYFIKKGGNYAVTTITRSRAQEDYFTDVCENCYEYRAESDRGVCKCTAGSLFLRDQSNCIDEEDFMSK